VGLYYKFATAACVDVWPLIGFRCNPYPSTSPYMIRFYLSPSQAKQKKMHIMPKIKYCVIVSNIRDYVLLLSFE